MKKVRTKTMMAILDQFYRIAMGTGEHESLRHKAYEAYCRYRNAMVDSNEYKNMHEHVVKCIEGRVSSDERRAYLYPEVGNLIKEEKSTIAGRITDTVVHFTRQEYAGF